MRGSLAVVSIIIGATGSALAADIGSPQAGREIAQRWCAECHDITGATPQVADAPPSLFTVANRAETTAAGLRAFLHTPHGKMPDLALSRDETDHVVAYILGMKRR